MKKTYREFMEFLKEYKILGLAIGIIIGNAVSSFVKSLVDDLIMPVIEVFIPGEAWREAVWTLRGIEFHAGKLIGSSVDLIVIALVVFLFVKIILKEEKVKKL